MVVQVAPGGAGVEQRELALYLADTEIATQGWRLGSVLVGFVVRLATSAVAVGHLVNTHALPRGDTISK